MSDTNTIQSFNIKADADVKSAEQGLSDLSSSAKKTEKDLNNFKADGLEQELEKIKEAVAQLSETFNNLTLKQLQQGQYNALKKIADITQRMAGISPDSKAYGKLAIALEYQKELARAYTDAIDDRQMSGASDMIREVGDNADQSSTKVNSFGESANDIFNQFLSLSSAIAKGSETVHEKTGNVIKSIGGMGKSFLSAISPMRLFNKEQLKTSLAGSLLGRAFSRVTRMFRIMITRMMIRAFISKVREGFGNIARYSEEVNRSFSKIGQSAHAMFNSVVASITPLIQALTPYLVAMFDAITKAFNKVAEIISAITGKDHFIKATKYNYDYVKSLDKSTSSTNKNTKATNKNKKAKKKLKDATIGIDRLNVISPDKNKNSNSNKGNGNKDTNVNDMFDTKPVSKKVKELAKLIKKVAKALFKPIKEAWDNVGDKVMSSWKSALLDIWETIKAVGRDFLEMWNEPETEKVLEDIFLIFAGIGDIVKTLSSNFRKVWTKEYLGLGIFESLRDALGVIVTRIKEAVEYTKEWAKNLDFEPLLKSVDNYAVSLKKMFEGITDILGDFYETVILGIYKGIVEKFIPNLIDVFRDFNNRIKWKQLSKHLHNIWEGIKHFASAVGQGLINFIQWLADGIERLANSKWFVGFLDKIGKLLKKTDARGVASGFKFLFTVWAGSKVIHLLATGLTKILTLIAKLRIAVRFLTTTTAGQFALIGIMIAGIVKLISIPYEQALDEGRELRRVVRENARNIGMSQGYKNKLKKQTEVNEKIHEEYEETKRVSTAIKDNYSELMSYKTELDGIVDKNGKIKKGFELQAELLVGKINEGLGTNLEIVDGQIKGYKKISKELEKQIRLITIKKLAEENAQKYYEAKSKIGNASEEHQKLQARWKEESKAGGFVYEYKYYDEQYKYAKQMEKEAKRRGDKGAEERFNTQKKEYKRWRDYYKNDYDTLKKSLKASSNKYRDYYRTILRQEELYGAKTKNQQDRAIAGFSKNVSKSELKTLNTIEKISKATGESVGTVMKKYVSNGKILYDKLPKKAKKVVETTTKEVDKATKKSAEKNAKQTTKSWADVIQKEAPDLWNSVQGNIYNAINSKRISLDDAFEYAKALTKAYKNGKDISKYCGAGIFKNKKSVQKAIEGLNGETDKLDKEKTTKVKLAGKEKFKRDVSSINKEIRDQIPKEIFVRISVKMNEAGLTKTQKGILKLSQIKSKGGTLQKQVKGADGHTYAYYTDKNGKTRKKRLFANGGYPKLGSEFIAGESGAELVGNINGKTGVASNQEITGIRDSIEDSSATQNQILMEQNNLLRALLEKNTDIVLDGEKVTKKVNKINARSGYRMAT